MSRSAGHTYTSHTTHTHRHTPGNLAHRSRSLRYQTLDSHRCHTHTSHARCRHPVKTKPPHQLRCLLAPSEPSTPFLLLLTPLLSRQVWLLLGHSHALPSHPSVHAHLPITQEPRSTEKHKGNIRFRKTDGLLSSCYC